MSPMQRSGHIDRPRWRGLAAAAALCVAAASSGAVATTDVAPPSEIGTALPAARPLGTATMRFLGWRVYDARLWAGAEFSASRFEAQPFALELQYARTLEGAAIARRSVEEMRRLGSIDDAQAEAWRTAMTRAFPDVAPGDRLTGLHLPEGRTRFFHNGRLTHEIEGRSFARLFFGIWLAPATSEPALRRQLLGTAAP